MSEVQLNADFDTSPPVPVTEYEQTVKSVNTGYELTFTLVHAYLRSLQDPNLELLVVGAGGGEEIAEFLPTNPGWQITGVDPSQDMLGIAAARAEQRGVDDRATLIRGSVDQLPEEQRFAAATCLYVLHFLPDDQKLSLLRGVARRLQPGAPVLIAAGCRVEHAFEDFLGTWQQYGELKGMPPDRMAGTIQSLLTQQTSLPTVSGYEQLMHQAGLKRSAPLLSVMGGGMCLWVAR
jgi:tRNA (cmo5U34)-methyltransferase